MAEIVLGIGTSHSPMLSLTAEQWIRYSQGDLTHKGLVYPPEGFSMTYDEGLQRVSAATRARPMTEDFFQTQVEIRAVYADKGKRPPLDEIFLESPLQCE